MTGALLVVGERAADTPAGARQVAHQAAGARPLAPSLLGLVTGPAHGRLHEGMDRASQEADLGTYEHRRRQDGSAKLRRARHRPGLVHLPVRARPRYEDEESFSVKRPS